MVAADEGNAIWVANLETQKEEERLERIEAAVDKVALELLVEWPKRLRNVLTHEQVVGVGNIATDAEQLHQIVKLAVYVTTYLEHLPSASHQQIRCLLGISYRHWRIDACYIPLFYKQFPRFEA